MRFRAAVLHAVKQPLAIEELELDRLGDSDVLVRMGASGLCHTDWEVIHGALPFPLPIVLGHEGAGTVEAVGRAVTAVKPGDRVLGSWNPNCGRCFYCDRDQPILCEPLNATVPRGQLIDGGTRLRLAGSAVHHFTQVSSHSEFAVLPESGAVRIPDAMPFDRACVIGCGVATGVCAVIRRARVEPGAAVVVIGCGAVGLNAVQGARLAGAEPIVAVDIAPDRLEVARRMGATIAIDAREQDALAEIRGATGGRGADYVFECGGNPSTMRLAIEATRTGGMAVILGKVPVNDEVPFRFGSMMGEKVITRSSYGNTRPRRDFPWLCRMYLEGKLMLDELITRRIRLDEINDGFTEVGRGGVVRAVIDFAR